MEYERDDYTDVRCPVCGAEFECSLRQAAAEVPPCCCTDCEQQWPAVLKAQWDEWEAERHYRCGYDYACGYYD